MSELGYVASKHKWKKTADILFGTFPAYQKAVDKQQKHLTVERLREYGFETPGTLCTIEKVITKTAACCYV